MVLAGRCECGFSLALVELDPELHLACRGLKRCRTCRNIKAVGEFHRRNDNGQPRFECKRCHADRANAHNRKRYLVDPAFRLKKAEEKRLDREIPALREKERERHQAYHQRNRVARNARSRRYHATHREELCAQARERYQRNRETRLAKQRAHYEANREQILARKRSRDRTATKEAA